ncbi:MAG: hypothetical protein JWR09_1520 [Mucilaginibacter sp.]|nr:hypothetical protein [Mucilaginibacter sp.]
MKFPHPYFFYQLSFKLRQPSTQRLITKVAKTVKTWNGVTKGIHRMGAKEFLIQKKEFGHIHWNGDLDILFGKPLTVELVKLNLVQRHKFVPEIAITYPLTGPDSIFLAITLLRFSYLLQLKKSVTGDSRVIADSQKELEAISFYPLIKHLV